MRRSPVPALLLIGLAACSAGSELSDPALEAALDRIRPEAIEEHMRHLASDELEGRGTGTRGHLLAADYVARQFETFGLEAAGDDGDYFQSVPLRSSRLLTGDSSLALLREGEVAALEIERDLLIQGDFLRERAEITAPAAFVGFGVIAPEHDHDDYAGIDVTGKIVLLYRGAPARFPHNERAYHASTTLKMRTAAERGAVGLIQLLLPDEHRRMPWDRAVRHSRMASMRWIEADGRPHDVFPELFLRARLSPDGERAFFAGAPRSRDEVIEAIEAGRPQSFDLPLKVSARTASRHAALESPNVIGLLRGSDPRLREEYVALTAHLDHVGIGDAVDGDGIHNGAYDNASGVSMLIEIARALSGLVPAPRRSILFLAVTGEEKGLLGSEYFAHHPSVPIDAIVANVNLDMAMMLHPLLDLVAFGAEHSSLSRPMERAAAHLGILLSPDPIPEEVLFIRSDQYSFVQQGIPALFVVSGFATPDPSVNGREQFEEWMRTTYHSPGDDMDQAFDFDAGARFARVNFLTTYLIAGEEPRPTWNPGDFFGELFPPQRSSRASE